MLKKVGFIPDKIYRVSCLERVAHIGTLYQENRKKIKTKGCYFELKSYQKSSNTVKVDVVDNVPIKDVRIISDNTVLINGEYDILVDNDFIADIAFNALSSKGGKLKGSYCFVAISDKLKFTRVDGPLYNQVLVRQNRRKAPKLKVGDFQKGGVYSTPSGVSAIFLGAVNTEVPLFGGKKYETISANRRLLFCATSREDPFFDWESVSPYSLEIKKSHSFIEKVSSVKIPKDVVSEIRAKMLSTFKRDIVTGTERESGTYWLNYKFFRYCPLINMYEPGEEKPKVFDMNKYLTYA